LTEGLGTGVARPLADRRLLDQRANCDSTPTVNGARLCRTRLRIPAVSVRPAPECSAGLRRPSAATVPPTQPATPRPFVPELPTTTLAANLAVWLLKAPKTDLTRLAGSIDSEPVTKLARRQLEQPLSERWPPKDGQPAPTLERARLAMSADRAPLASGRVAHADDGAAPVLTMNHCAFTERRLPPRLRA